MLEKLILSAYGKFGEDAYYVLLFVFYYFWLFWMLSVWLMSPSSMEPPTAMAEVLGVPGGIVGGGAFVLLLRQLGHKMQEMYNRR